MRSGAGSDQTWARDLGTEPAKNCTGANNAVAVVSTNLDAHSTHCVAQRAVLVAVFPFDHAEENLSKQPKVYHWYVYRII